VLFRDMTETNSYARMIRICRRRLLRVRMESRVRVWLTWGLLGLGALLLGAKALGIYSMVMFVWGCAAVLAGAAITAAREIMLLPDDEVIRAWLDKRSGARGLLMVEPIADLGSWNETIHVAMPSLRVRHGRSDAWLALAVIFVASVLLVSPGQVALGVPGRLQVDTVAENMAEQIEVAEEADLLDEQELEQLKEKLNSLWEEADDAGDPASVWAGLDQASRVLNDAVAERMPAYRERLDRIEQAAILADMLERLSQDGADAGMLSESARELAELLKQAGLSELLEAAGLDAETFNKLSGGQCDAATLDALKDALSKAGDQQIEALRRLCQSRLADPSALRQCESGREAAAAELMEWIEGQTNTACLVQCLACANPGKGGVSRGPGHAALTWSGQSSEKDSAFKEQTLPAGPGDLADSIRVGLFPARPETNIIPVRSSAASVLSGGKDTSAIANDQHILPRHAAAVRAYFNREQQREE